MPTKLLRTAILFLFGALAGPALAQTTVVLQDGLNGYMGTADSKMWSGAPDTTYDETVWHLLPTTVAVLARWPIFQAEGGPVPAGARIISAKLSAYKFWGPDGVFKAQRLLRPWQETQATWNSAAAGSAWATPGALGASDVNATADGQGSIGTAEGWVDFDVTSGVQAFAAGAPNHGWRLSQVGGSTQSHDFIARNHPNQPTLRPKLTITYDLTPPPTQGSVTLQDGLNGYTGTADSKMWSGAPNTTYDETVWHLLPTTVAVLARWPIFRAEGGPVPDGATITSATLSAYKFWGPDGVFKAQRLLRPWEETQATWNSAATGSAWATPGALGATDVNATADGQGSIGAAEGWVDFDVTAGVQAFASGAPNHGWRLSQVSGSTQSHDFIARNHPNQPTLRPKLTVTYTTASVSSCLSGPYNGTPAGTGTPFEAENYDCGGEGVAYHDVTAGSNPGQTYRADESVEVITAPGGYAVNHFDTGEWMVYTINVPTAGNYDLAILASSNHPTAGAYRIEIDGVDATGSVTVPVTGSWDVYQWVVGRTNLALTAGQHKLKLVSVAQSFRVDQIRVTPSQGEPACTSGAFSGSPAVPGTPFEAENFDCGGEGIGYHDTSIGNNAGQTYRAGESVEIIAAPGGLAVNHFDQTEWMVYTISVATAGTYDLGILASSNHPTAGAFRIEINNVDVTGSVPVEVTGSWDNYQWVTKAGVALSAGTHKLKLVSVTQSFRVDKLRILASVPPPPPPPGGTGGGTSAGCPAAADFCHSFETSTTEGGAYGLQAASTNRLTAETQIAAHGLRAVRLRTSGSDTNINGSGTWERAELSLGDTNTGAVAGVEQWWANSVYLPEDFKMPPSSKPYEGHVVTQFHASPRPAGTPNYGQGQPNISIYFVYEGCVGCGLVLKAKVSGGSELDADAAEQHRQTIHVNPTKGRWYDFVQHIRWSSTGTGFYRLWLRIRDQNGVEVRRAEVVNRANISTLYPTLGAYLKIGSYHAHYGNFEGSVIHDRVVRGASFDAVSPFPCPIGSSCQ